MIATILADALWQYLAEGDFIGFIIACYTSRIGQGFYGIVMLMIFGVLYNKTKSVALCGISWLLIGTALIATMPLISPLVVIFITFGIAGIIYDLLEARYR